MFMEIVALLLSAVSVFYYGDKNSAMHFLIIAIYIRLSGMDTRK